MTAPPDDLPPEDDPTATAGDEGGEDATRRRVRLVRKEKPTRRRVVLRKRRPDDPAPEDTQEADDPPDHVVYEEAFEAAFEGEGVDADADGDVISRLARMLAVDFVPAVARKIVAAGGSALTEDLIRRAFVETPLPSEVGGFLAGQAESVRKEFYRIVASEVAKFLQSVNLAGELQKILTSLSFEIRTEIRFIPNDQAVRADGTQDGADPAQPGVKPDVKTRVKVKRDSGRPSLLRWRRGEDHAKDKGES